MKIHNYAELMEALNSPSINKIIITDTIYVPQSIHLPQGLTIEGVNKEQAGLFFGDGEGIGLTENNTLKNLTIQVSPIEKAIFIASIKEDLGTIELENLNVTGQVQLITRETTEKLNLKVKDVDIASADVRLRKETQSYFGVEVTQGAFTVYNFCNNDNSLITLDVEGISIGRKGAPVLGSGFQVAGNGVTGGKVKAERIVTGAIYSNGMLPLGVNDIISGGCFILAGVEVDELVNAKEIVTYGVNGMVLDNWGTVKKWIAQDDIVSYGPSGIGFVNFGIVDQFESTKKIETFGLGARGFNQYEGTINKATFNEIITHGDGAIGIQVSQPVGEINVNKTLITKGSVGRTLVKGKIFELSADGISVLEGGTVQKLILNEGVRTEGDHVITLKVLGKVEEYINHGKVEASGKNSEAIKVEDNGYLKEIELTN